MSNESLKRILDLKNLNAAITDAKINYESYQSLQNEFLEFFELYNKKLRLKKKIDMSDILFLSIKLFLNYPQVLEKYQILYKYILIDEFQDTNPAQLYFIKLLGKKSFITVCGDDDQAIYG